MKTALFWNSEKDHIQCRLCPHLCKISSGKTGRCKTRKNIKNELVSLVYKKPICVHVDPIEKKPLYHFIPGSNALSIGTLGCNFSCKNCQNADISQAPATKFQGREISPEEIVNLAKKYGCKTIAYTYNEPTVFYEYMLEIAKLASKKGMYNIIVSNGYINSQPLKKLIPYLDAANIDLKSMSEKFYEEICGAQIDPVLSTLRTLHKKVHLEITNLVIPGMNDKPKQIEKLCKWIKENLDEEVPLHFSAFHPAYHLKNLPRTSLKSLREIYKSAKKIGLKNVYIGNILDPTSETTYCAKCGKALIRRSGFELIEKNTKNGRCSCGKKVKGIC